MKTIVTMIFGMMFIMTSAFAQGPHHHGHGPHRGSVPRYISGPKYHPVEVVHHHAPVYCTHSHCDRGATLLVSINGITDIEASRLAIGLPGHIQVVNEFGLGDRRYMPSADLRLEVRHLHGSDYVVELIDAHAPRHAALVASWAVDRLFSNARWNIERCLSAHKHDIHRIAMDWTDHHHRHRG